MPIYLANCYQTYEIKRITGTDAVRMHLKTLGFVVGEKVMVIQKVGDNIIVKIKGVSMAIGKDLAKRILL